MNSIKCYRCSGFIFLTVLIVVAGWLGSPLIYPQQNFRKTSEDGIDILQGKITKDDIYGAPRAKPVVPKKRPQRANIPYQRTNSPTGGTRGPLGSG